jgi:hypothetical protein
MSALKKPVAAAAGVKIGAAMPLYIGRESNEEAAVLRGIPPDLKLKYFSFGVDPTAGAFTSFILN